MNFGSQTQTNPQAAFHADVDARASFIMKTYVHLVGAIFAFVFLEAALFASGIATPILELIFSTGRMGWLVVLGLFIGTSWVADRWARNATSPLMQYAGLGLFIVAESIVFLPMIFIASMYDPQAIPIAAGITLAVFLGLTAIVFVTKKDFSFMRGMLGVAAMGAFAVIACSLIFGFSLGIVFSGAMVVLASGYILYNTSNVLHHYRTDQHVAAALTLFADVALLFWYILRIFMSRR